MVATKANSTLGEFLRLFFPVAAIALLVIIAVAAGQRDRFRQDIEVRQRATVAMERQALESSLSGRLSDAVLLADITGFHVFGDMPEAELKRHLVQELSAFSAAKRVYDQVRFIDATGKEAVRINWSAAGPVPVDSADLQDKSERSYFYKALRIRGEVYVSALDLNVERGRAEEPLEPMVRLATPVVDSSGTTAGVVVLNYLGDHLLDRLRQVPATTRARLYLVNPAGYWLIGPRPDDEWAFMFPDRVATTMETGYPEAWAHVSASESGQFLSAGTLFTYETASPSASI